MTVGLYNDGTLMADRCLRDVVALSTLPAMWLGADPLRIVESLGAALYTMLDADLVYVHLQGRDGHAPVAIAQTGRTETDAALARTLAPRLFEWALAHDPDEVLTFDTGRHAGLHVTTRLLGLHGDCGLIAAGFLRPTAPEPAHHLLLNVAATQATIATHGVRLLWSVQQTVAEREDARAREHAAREDVEALYEVAGLLGRELDVDKLLQKVTDSATRLTGAAFGAFFYNRTNAAGESYMLYTLSGAPREQFDGLGMPRNTAIFEPTFRGTSVVRLEDVTKDPRYGRSAPHHGMPRGHLPVRSYLAVPVHSRGGQPLGGLFFGHPEPAIFTDRAERLAVGIAAQASIALDNARLYEQAQREIEERRQTEDALRESDRARKGLLELERAARTHAEAASRLKDEFLALLSHELRTPLNSILGWSRMVRDWQLPPERLKHALEVIERNARAQAELTEDLLDLSRIMTGKLRLNFTPTNLAAVIAAAADSARPGADAKGIRLDLELDETLPLLAADADRLQQIVWNLLSNAIKFTRTGGRIRVGLARNGESAEICVTDTGQGIPASFLPHVFERFRQADSTPSRRHGGLGLGLAIVRELVEGHGGTVSAESGGEGLGATFRVMIPLRPVSVGHAAQQASGDAASDPAGSAPNLLDGVHVLLVDDDDDTRELLMVTVQAYGATVTVAASTLEALALFSEKTPDIVVADIGMPGEDGYSLIRQLRERDRGGRIPAIAVTAYASLRDRQQAISAGFDAHIAKPVEREMLAHAIAGLVQRV